MKRRARCRPEQPFFEENGIKLFTDDKNAAALNQVVGSGKSLAAYLRAHLGRLKAGDYFATAGVTLR